MADENVTASENTNETTEQATTPAVKASKPAVPSPASMKPHAPSPAAFAKKAPQHTAPAAASTGFSDADVKTAEAFGRVADDGTVFVKDGEGEREVGQFPDASKEEALALYARRYLDLKAKLDLFANKLKSNNVKSREIDETIKTLSAETEQPAVVGDLAALKAQFEALKEEGAAKKTALTEARKAAIAKAVEERTAIVEKAEALADSLDENTNWRSTADKFRSLFQQWQEHQRNNVRIDKEDADALWARFSAARTKFNFARRKWVQNRDEERNSAKSTKEAIIAEAEALQDSTAWVETSRKFTELVVVTMMPCGSVSAPPQTPSSTHVRPIVIRSAPPRRKILPRRKSCWSRPRRWFPSRAKKRPSRPVRLSPPFRRSGTRSVTCRVTKCAASKAVSML